MLTDGIITEAMAARVSLAVPPDRTTAAVAALIDQRFWTRTEAGDSQIVDFGSHAFPAEQVRRTQARWAADKRRRRQHDVGDHALCKDPKYCPAIRADSTVDVQVDSTRIDQTRPDQTKTRPEEGEVGAWNGKGNVGSASGDRAPASGGHGSSATPPGEPSPWAGYGPPPGITLNGVPVALDPESQQGAD